MNRPAGRRKRAASRIVVALLLLGGGAWAALWIGSVLMRDLVSAGEGRAWPLGLGTLSEVPKRYPVATMSRGAAQLVALAATLGIDLAPRDAGEVARPLPGAAAFVRGQLGGWVTEQLRTPVPDIEPMPSESGEYLAAHGADIAAAQRLLRSGDAIVWPQNLHDPARPLPALLGHLDLQRVLIARALDRSRAGDRGAWDDLEAAWRLAQSLTARPELISHLTALAMARRVNAAARKLPLPAAAWFSDLEQFDARRALIAAYQVDAWSMADRVYAETSIDAPDEELGVFARKAVDAVMAPYTQMSAADLAEQWRRTAADIASMRTCSIDVEDVRRRTGERIAWWNAPARAIATPNLDAIWPRAFRFVAEREATVRALRLREGAPPMPQSVCADGQWIYDDSKTAFRFSRVIDDPSLPANAIPLEFSVSPSAASSSARE